jgi:hypothetical protein
VEPGAVADGERTAGNEDRHRRDAVLRVSWCSWLTWRRWTARYDLTFRYGTDECTRKGFSVACAERRLKGFLVRLMDARMEPITYFAVMEWQRREVPHWHVLVEFERTQWSPGPDEVKDLWQYWHGWRTVPQDQGVEGHVWVRFVKQPADVRYVVKYILKSMSEYHVGRVTPGGLFGLGVTHGTSA